MHSQFFDNVIRCNCQLSKKQHRYYARVKFNFNLPSLLVKQKFLCYGPINNSAEKGPPKVKAWWRYSKYFRAWIRASDKKLRYCVNDQSGIQRDWVNLAWTRISGNFRVWFVHKKLRGSGISSPPWEAPLVVVQLYRLQCQPIYPTFDSICQSIVKSSFIIYVR